MADNNENILVEFDYNNISIIDPNKVIDNNGNIKERYIKQEDLVIYANLECTVVPRTKLSIGGALNDTNQTVRLASINFLNPGLKDFLDNSYTDELTGKNSLFGKGVNQFSKKVFKNPNKSDDFYTIQQIKSNGNFGSVDNGMLGITNISIKQNTSFLTQISIQLEDIKGRTLFESGNESPYAAFFNLPYPLFYLTIKGYVGKAVRIALMLTKFNGRYDTPSGNFKIQLDFLTYKYTILSEISMGALMATPHMYKTKISIPETTGGPSNTTNIQETVVEKGYQKIKELYSEYKNKGLIPENFPELTLVELTDKIENFLKIVLDDFGKQDLDSLTHISEYKTTLEEYRGEVFFYQPQSWFNKYMDINNFFVINENNKKYRIYKFKEEVKKDSEKLKTELKTLIEKYKKILKDNKTLGNNGSYTINGKAPKNTRIPFDITFETFVIKVEATDIDRIETYRQRKNIKQSTTVDLSELGKNIKIDLSSNEYFRFEGIDTFVDITNKMLKDLNTYKEQIETDLTKALAEILKSPNKGLGFSPTIRNILAIVFANGEAFLRLMDDVHTAANALQNNETRRNVILDPQTRNITTNTPLGPITDTTPIYPWPQVINITNDDGKEKYEIKYPGDPNLKDITKAYNFDIWPEVEFVEEFLKGYIQRESPPDNPTPTSNELTEPRRTTYNSIEFPVNNNLFSNKEQTKFLYEIYERVILNTYYSRLSRSNTNNAEALKITEAVGECETENIILGLGDDSPFLVNILKNYGITAENILDWLFTFSNEGKGESWNNYINGVFNTKYIRNLVNNAQFQFLDISLFEKTNSRPLISLEKENDVKKYITGTTSNVLDVTDIYPFTNLDWCKQYLEKGSNITNVVDIMDTSNVLSYNDTFKIITNFSSTKEVNKNKPFTNFLGDNTIPVPDSNNLTSFYSSRKDEYQSQIITEGNINYNSGYGGSVGSNQTTSIFNTPYFTNAIQNGVERFFSGSPYPYVSAAYLFLNSLPLGTLKEKLKTLNNTATEEKSYLYASLKKFGGVHKLPYAWILKYGSIWHRYKTYIEGGSTPNSDILTPIWKNFDYIKNYDPISSDPNKNYNLTINGETIDVNLENFNINTFTINTGFYPKLINDFSVFYIGSEIIKPNSQIIGIGGITNDVLTTTTNLDLQVGDIIVGNYIAPNTTIVDVISPTTYRVNITQQAINDFIFVTNRTNPGYTNQDIQNSFFSGLTLDYKIESESAFPFIYRIISWKASLKVENNQFVYLLPSVGNDYNQATKECFKNGISILPITGNVSIYNGSVRSYWSAPNYGYFDSDSLVKPTPFQYVKNIVSTDNISSNYSINGESNYSQIDELFSVFNKETLDKFELEFLKFSRSIYDFEDENVNSGTLLSIAKFKNFQALIREIMKVPNNGNLLEEQFKSINDNLNDFLNYDVIVKIGNPANFDRKLFYTFSNLDFENPYMWRSYSVFTPNFLPKINGNTNLVTSQNLYPQLWRTLYLYIGFSTIEELKYKDNGSFITDFFIDFDIEFSIENIKLFAPIIKIYATQKLIKFQNNFLPSAPLPNDSEEILLVTYELSNLYRIEILQQGSQKIVKSYYDTNILIFQRDGYGYTLANDFIFNNIFTILFPTNPPTIISVNENEIPQFDIDPSPLNPAGRDALKESITLFLRQSEDYLNKILNNVFTTLRNKLKDVTIEKENRKISDLEGTQTKDELWEVFKALNDKWIAGADISSRTLFEDILILDRANRNIGDKFLVDVFALKNRLLTIPDRTTMLLFVQTILVENHFQVLNIPGYVNFYNVQDVTKNPIPRPEGSLEIGNTLFGVYNNVDYTNSSTKMVCVYAGKPSEHLDIKNVDYRWRSDAFEITRVSDNPIVEDQIDKTDWDKSNKVVGFNVDIGPQNQSIIKSFQVSQNGGLSTMESLRVINEMANQAGNRSSSSQSVSLYNLYKNRSYTCSLSMLGNAMIQPTMYFNLRYVPMFNGPYLITEVNHTISPGDFSTDIVGVRQPMASLPTVDNFLQSIRQNLLKKIIEKRKQEKVGKLVTSSGNVVEAKDQIIETIDGSFEPTNSENCNPNETYNNYSFITTPEKINQSFSKVKTEIELQIRSRLGNDDGKLKYVIFAAMYLGSSYKYGFDAFEHNYSGVKLTESWYSIGRSTFGRRPQYFCLKNNEKNTQTPYAVFPGLIDHIVLLIELWKNKVITYTPDADGITKFLILNKGNYKSLGDSVYESMTDDDKTKYKNKVQEAINKFNES